MEIGLYERKLRRRERAAILNPKTPPPPGDHAPPVHEPDELPDEWWDEFRRSKRGLVDATAAERNGSSKGQQASRLAGSGTTSPKLKPEPRQHRIKTMGEGRGRKGKDAARSGRLGIQANYQPPPAIQASQRLTVSFIAQEFLIISS